jgi:hypothetical protein
MSGKGKTKYCHGGHYADYERRLENTFLHIPLL